MKSKSERRALKDEFRGLLIQTKNNDHKKRVEIPWVVKIILVAFLVSLGFSTLSESLLPNVNLITGIIIVILFVALGILFDIIGVAVTSADITPFNSMSSRKVKASKIAVNLIKNADKVSSFCCDVIGDVCGIISGTASTIVAASIAVTLKIDVFVVALLTTAIVASLTIGGKALGKSFAINKSSIIVFEFAKFLDKFYKIK